MTTNDNTMMHDFELADDGIEIPDVEDDEMQDRLTSLVSSIRESWSYENRQKIDEIKPGSDGNTVIIQSNDGDDPSLLGPNVQMLFNRGWGIAGVKGGNSPVTTLFFSRIQSDDGSAYLEGAEEDDLIYAPKPCDVCGDREYVEHVEVAEPPEDVEGRPFTERRCEEHIDITEPHTERGKQAADAGKSK